MAVLDLRFCARASSSCGKRGPLFIAVRGPLTIAASLVVEHRLRRAGSVIVAHGPICSAACGIFPDQGSNPCPLHWQADSQPLRHQGSPITLIWGYECAAYLFYDYKWNNQAIHQRCDYTVSKVLVIIFRKYQKIFFSDVEVFLLMCNTCKLMEW